MKFLDFSSLFNTEPANLAVLSTYQLDADFFERRILRCPALVKARRVLVFMDSGQWFNLVRQDVVARFLNRRYLVVPVKTSQGVFHPKLNLLVTERSGQVQCGSNNLTRSGCSSNLELLNSFWVDIEEGDEEAIRIAQEAFAFFKRACDAAEEQPGGIAREWLEESRTATPWLAVSLPPKENRKVRLVHTYDGSLWEILANLLDQSPPKKLLIISPFHDVDAEMTRRVHLRWPRCKIEFVVQQKTTNLPVLHLKKFRANVKLSELCNSSRRLHAKLLAWESSKATGCLVGSANFTSAAFDARNVETCLLMSDAEDSMSSLFDKQFAKKAIAFDEFDPGTEPEPKPFDAKSISLHLISAILRTNGELRVVYRHQLKSRVSSLRVAIRTQGEQRPRAFLSVPNQEKGTATVIPPETAFTDAHGTILASLVAEVEDRREESPSIWIIQEGRLTYEPTDGGSSPQRSKVEETGEGLTEFLDELGKRDGVASVIEYLRHLNIRFNDGGDGLPGKNKFRLRIRDPFQPDIAPGWLVEGKTETANLAEAIFDFADRHEKRRLRRHAKRGNINGMENFLDIFTALVRLLYIYHVRGIVHPDQMIGRVSKYLEVATSGVKNAGDNSEGYLYTLHSNLGGDSAYLREICDELNMLGQLRAALLIVQKVRYVPGERVMGGPPKKRLSECLPHVKDELKTTVKELHLKEPSRLMIRKALEEYQMFTSTELTELEDESLI